MFRKTTLLIAAGAGYVLGTKAGKERYDQIEAKFRELAGMPAVQSATESFKDTAQTVKSSASSVADNAVSTVNDKVETAADKADKAATKAADKSSPAKSSPTIPPAAASDPVIDIGTGASTSGPRAGASASVTAPDVI